MSASQRRKGSAYEREVAEILSTALGVQLKRKLGQARDGGDDLELPRAGGGRFRIECKRRRTIGCERFLRQVEAACEGRDVPIVVMRADGCRSIVALRIEDFLPLLAGELP